MRQQRTILAPPLRDETQAYLKKLRIYERLLWGVLGCKAIFLLSSAIALQLLRGHPTVKLPYFGLALGLLATLTILTGVIQLLFLRKGNQLVLYLASQHSELKTEDTDILLDTLSATQLIGGLDEKIPQARRQLDGKLLELLPKLNEAQCLALTKTQRSYLRGWAKNRRPAEQVAALLVLASAKDTKSIPLAKRLARQTQNPDESVQEAAADFLKQVE